MKKSFVSLFAVQLAAMVVSLCALSSPARASDDVPPAPPSPGPELNPFECYGRYQYATENRTIAEMRHELKQRLEWLDEAGQPDTVLAIKLCVIAKLKARVGDMDAWDYYERSLKADPVEPGLELWAAQYWTGHRGARRPVVEPAEDHYYAALRKLEAIKKAGRWKEYHTIVEDWVHHDLVVLYQMDGLPLLPWKAYPQHSDGLKPPGVSLSSQLRMAKDTRDFFFNNEYRQFTGEKAFANSLIRSGGSPPPYGPLDARQTWELVRAPYRLQFENKLRIRQNDIGTFDVLHTYLRQWSSQVYNFYDPTRYCNPPQRDCDATLPQFSDIQVQQVGLGYERVFPLYPVVDLRLAGSVQRVWRDGIVEFHPWNVNHPGVSNVREALNLYEFKPSVSRFLGADKLTVNGVLAVLDLPSQPAPIEDRLRRKIIKAVTFEYGDYHPLVLPTIDYGGLSTYRTPTRGLYFFGGLMQDGEAYGSHRVVGTDYYLGTRFEGPHWTDFTLQGTYETTNIQYYDVSGHGPTVLYSDPGQTFSSFRTTFVLQYRVRSADTFPGMPPSHGGFGSDMFHLVFPIFWDKETTGPKDYENVRAGAQIWTKLIGEGIGGTTFLVTAGVDYQYFYQIQKGLVVGQLALRMGWGDL
ncbi:MAG TPA: hypothetical protein VHJ20_16575 [Polyangia bacterium]|nr:hypothetical protein [Polyangia bacterium]